MDCMEKISRSVISEIDDYYAKSDKEKAKAIIYQNRYKRFKKLEQAYEAQTGRSLNGVIDYDQMFGCIPYVKPEKLVLAADDMLMILVYILIQAKISTVKLYSHIRMVYEF